VSLLDATWHCRIGIAAAEIEAHRESITQTDPYLVVRGTQMSAATAFGSALAARAWSSA
jgi:hypothetical protein